MVAAALTASLFALSEHAKYFRKEADTVDQISVACSGITFFLRVVEPGLSLLNYCNDTHCGFYGYKLVAESVLESVVEKGWVETT
jgi:hypothetical protein